MSEIQHFHTRSIAAASGQRLKVAFFDTKSYDQDAFQADPGFGQIQWDFHEERLKRSTVALSRGAQAVCCFVNDVLDGPVLEALAAEGVSLIALRCAGFNQVDLETCHRLDLRVVRVPAYSPHSVAEHSVALLLSLARRIPKAYNRVRESNFSLRGLVGLELHGKTVGIVGTGRIGQVAAQLFRGFGCRVLCNDPYPDLTWAQQVGAQFVPFWELTSESDVVSLYLPLQPGTYHLFDEKVLQGMKRGALLINTSRGALVDTSALIECLKSGQIGGAALDVYEEESGLFFRDLSDQVLQDDVLARLLSFPNVLVTAHQAFLTSEALAEIAAVTVDNLSRFAAGQELLHQL